MKPEDHAGQKRRQNPGRRPAGPGAATTSRQRKQTASARPGNERKRKNASASRPASTTGRKPASAPVARSGAGERRRHLVSTARPPRKNTRPRTVRPPEARPEVVYIPAKPVSRNRFLLQLVTVVAVVLAMTFVISLFFKVETITVSGADVYDPWTIREASGIQEGDGLLTFSKARASGQIKTELPYVKNVMIGIKLPDTVNIMIEESDVAYAIAAEDDSWWLMSAEGKILEKTTKADAGNVTMITGLELNAPVGTQAEVDSDGNTDVFGETIPVVITGQKKLEILLEILQNLEINGVIGQVVRIDVTDHNNMELWYGDRFQVKLGDASRLAVKIESMVKAIAQMKDYDAGVLDVSYTTWTDKVGFTSLE